VVTGSGKAIPGAHVRLSRSDAPKSLLEGVTDAEGRFRFGGLVWGDYTIDIAADGWKARQASITLRPDGTVYVNTTLVPPGSDQVPPRIQIVDDDVWYGTNFTPFSTQRLPNGRSVWSLLQGQEPSTVTNRFEVGEAEPAVPALFSAFGA
jgi:hypothetical protein